MKKNWLITILICIVLTGCASQSQEVSKPQDSTQSVIPENNAAGNAGTSEPSDVSSDQDSSENASFPSDSLFEGYRVITVDGGDMSGHREPNVAVDIGFEGRQYWAFTNEFGQLVRVVAKEIVLQNDSTEPVTADGRYYNDEAKVPGTELSGYDQGHVIADSLGGVSNAYNITPQESTLNRHGNQAYMEKNIRDAGGCSDFEAIITYPDTKMQIPSHYHFTYTLRGNVIVDDFDNVNPDEANKDLIESQKAIDDTPEPTPAPSGANDISSVDTNGNGKVTISEAKAAGYSMPITSDHWLYPFMDDRDGDGMVGE